MFSREDEEQRQGRSETRVVQRRLFDIQQKKNQTEHERSHQINDKRVEILE